MRNQDGQSEALGFKAANVARRAIEDASDAHELAALDALLRDLYPDDPEADALVRRIRVRQSQLDAQRMEEIVRS